MVIPIAVLEVLARIRPTTEAAFRAVEGIDDQKARNYAATFIAAIQVSSLACQAMRWFILPWTCPSAIQ